MGVCLGMTESEQKKKRLRRVLNKKPKPTVPDTSNLDLDPDAWPKFEKLIKSAAKMGPRPHSSTALAEKKK